MDARCLARMSPALLLCAGLAAAAQPPEGRWKTIDDETGRVKSIVEIDRAADGTLRGRVVAVLHSTRGPAPRCDGCQGANKGKPVKGMTILWGLRGEPGGGFAGGRILDPATGRTYAARMEMLGADRLGVSGCIAFFCRRQEWVRE